MTNLIKKIMALLCAAATLVTALTAQVFPVASYKDLPYGESGAQKLDLFLPRANKSACTAVVVYIHGGGWLGGDKDAYTSACERTVKRGYAAASLNYRMLNEEGISWADMLEDITLALGLVKAEAAKRGVFLQKAGLTGGSAGAHLAMLYAFKNQAVSPIEIAFCASQCGPSDFTDRRLYEESADPASIYSLVSLLVRQDVNPATFEAVTPYLRAASPAAYVNAGSPPTILAQGMKDPIIHYGQAVTVDEAFRAAGARSELILFPNSDHGLSSDPDCSERYDRLFKEFEQQYFGY